MKRRTTVAAIIVSACHFVLALVFLLLSIRSGFEGFDNPAHVPTPGELAVEGIASVLIQPGSAVWTPWMSKHMPDAVEWLLFLGNSLLWGFGLVLLIQLARFGKGRLSDNPRMEAGAATPSEGGGRETE